MEAMWSRFLPSLQQVRALLHSGELGKLLHIESHFGIQSGPNDFKRGYSRELEGIAISCVTAWLNLHIGNGNRAKRAMILGCLLFGVDLILFNFFMPLVFDADIPDLILRTLIDILTVTLGCLAFSNRRNTSAL